MREKQATGAQLNADKMRINRKTYLSQRSLVFPEIKKAGELSPAFENLHSFVPNM